MKIKICLILIFNVIILIDILPQSIIKNIKKYGQKVNNTSVLRNKKDIASNSNLFFWGKLNGPKGGMINGLKAFGDTLLVGVGNYSHSIYYSINRGEIWNKSNINIPVNGASDFTKVGDTYYSAINNGGIYKSSNLKDWINVRKDGNSYWSIGSDNKGRLFAGRYYWGGILGSTDSGKTWKDEQNLKSIVFEFLQTIKGTTIGSSWHLLEPYGIMSVLRRDKDSSQWNQQDFSFLEGTQLYICQNLKDSTIYLIPTNRPYCLVSSDDGLTWVNHDTSGFLWELYSQDATFINNSLIVGGYPDEFLSGWGIAVSDDKGYSWRYSNSGLPPYARVNKLTSSNNEAFAGLYGGGIYRTSNDGDNWIESMEGLSSASLDQFCLVKDSIIYSVSWGEGVQRSTDKGRTFTFINSPLFTNLDFYGILYFDSVLYSGGNDGFFISYDEGSNWIKKDNIVTFNIHRDRKGNIYRITPSGLIKSTDKGISWFYKSDGIDTNPGYAFACDSSNNLYYGTYMGDIYKSINEGESWIKVRNEANPEAYLFSIGVSPINNNLYAASSIGLLKSIDEGINWTNILPSLDGKTIFITQKGEVLAFDYNGGIFYSVDNGNNWLNITNNLDYITVTDVKEDSKGNLILGTWDGLYISDDPVLNVDNKYNIQVYSYSLSQNYPNPFNPSTKINFSLKESGLVTLKIYNLLGEEIITLINSEINEGEHTIAFDASNFSSGIYFYTIKINNYSKTLKLMVIK